MPLALDEMMETASQALAELDYARCEALCVEALGQAKRSGDWVMYGRVLLPLQEARRQKRQAAIDGLILLGTPSADAPAIELITDPRCGCVVLTRPYTAENAAKVDAAARDAHRSVEVLYADNTPDASAWRIHSFEGPGVTAELPAPDASWVGRWIDPQALKPPTPAHWFMRASEALGDAALAQIDAPLGSAERVDRLEAALRAAGDHEILHQRLAEAAKALHGARR